MSPQTTQKRHRFQLSSLSYESRTRIRVTQKRKRERKPPEDKDEEEGLKEEEMEEEEEEGVRSSSSSSKGGSNAFGGQCLKGLNGAIANGNE